MKCRASEPKTPPQPRGVATRTGGRDEGNQSQALPPSPWAGPRAALRSGFWTIQPERGAFQSRGRPSGAAAAQWADAAERPRERTMEWRVNRRGFSRRAGLGFSGTTATARVFGSEAGAPRRGLCPSVPRLSVPHRTNRVAPCGAAIAVDGQKTPPHPAFDGASQECRGGAASHPTPIGARELETRPFSRGKVKVPGHSKVFPIGMCYIWEVEGDNNSEVFKEVPIFIISERHHKAQPAFSVGLFF